MAGGGAPSASSRELDQTPTWAVSAVCAVIILISILLEKVLHAVGEMFAEKKKKAMLEALEKLKGELMVLGFISLLLTFGQTYITKICIPDDAANTMLPCPKAPHIEDAAAAGGEVGGEGGGAAVATAADAVAAAAADAVLVVKGYVSLISINGLHQLHIFIFFLAVFHVTISGVTMTLGRLKIREWKTWERETEADQENVFCIRRGFVDPSQFRLTHETSFVRDHSHLGKKNAMFFYLVSFSRQFFRSVRKADYLTMRHGFVTVHLAPGSKFDFQKYIKRSLEDDFKVVVGITFICSEGAYDNSLLFGSNFQERWLNFFGISIEFDLKGIPLVQVSDSHFWFSWPQLVLYLIHFVLFQNAFEITYFFWIWYEFGLKSCFHENFNLVIIRVALGVGVQVLCSYITLPLYALVTQMGSTMKQSIFDEQTSKALKQWRNNAKKKNEGNPGGYSLTPFHASFVAAISLAPTEKNSVMTSRGTPLASGILRNTKIQDMMHTTVNIANAPASPIDVSITGTVHVTMMFPVQKTSHPHGEDFRAEDVGYRPVAHHESAEVDY
ncbi:hypothetical protein MLD38_022155 [Melastoma candidum]|uniref:Uncharacterized protein n=1 Tax=Melastoma candidum TaxID=119954 RepID=A0ACB9QLS3_9MYRT|nr:hypothetical protein MLD38_022155 [Melastoma candidum]